MEDKFMNLESLIGNTPMIEITFEYKGKIRFIYVKLESFNMSGSIKDRMALNILKKAYKNELIQLNDTIVEATSGNTGISFAAIGKALGYRVHIFMPDWMSEERKKIIKSLGAEISLVTKEEGGFLGCINKTEELAKNDSKVFLPCQFSNEDNVEAHYLSTGPEIWDNMKNIWIIPDGFVAGVGTGGTIMGIGRYLKEQNENIKVFPLEPSNSRALSGLESNANHRIQGIGDGFIPSIVNLDELDEIIDVEEGDSIIMAQKIAKELGLGVGISSGANFLGAIKASEILGENSVVVTIFVDDNKKYLSTDLLKEEQIKSTYISPKVKLLRMRTI